MNISCIQLASDESESVAERLERVERLVMAEAPSADVVVLPELWLTGYFSFDRYAEDARTLDDPVFQRLGRLSRQAGLHLFAGTFVVEGPAGLANCAVVLGPDGDIIHTYRKIHLFGYGSEEARLLEAGDDAAVFGSGLGTFATTTCYDLRFPELYRVMVDRGAEIVVIPAAWPSARREHWQVLLRARAIENQCFVIACNGAGTQRGVELAGHSVVVDPWGRVVAEAGAATEVLRAVIETDDVPAVRREFPVLEHRRRWVDGRPGRRVGTDVH